MKKSFITTAFCFMLTLMAHAQFTTNNQTITISGVISNWTGDYLVGNTNFLDTLLVQSTGKLDNNIGYIGYAAGANSNAAIISDAGSVWSNHMQLYVGYGGSDNRLVVSNQGAVVSLSGFVGFVSSNNSVLVTGSGSIWNGDVYVGFSGASNSLVINNQGKVMSSSGYMAYNTTASIDNSVVVSGSGSVWNCGVVGVGFRGAGNRLVISNQGAVVVNVNGIVGWNSTSSNNSVLVTDNSVWSNRFALIVGNDGAYNSLLVSNQSKVWGITEGAVGYIAGAHNSVVVTGTGSVWSTGGTLSIGSSGDGNTLTIINGGVVSNGSTSASVGIQSSSSNNSVLVSGPGSIWKHNGSTLYIGNLGTGNSLVISNQGAVASSFGQVGGGSGASNSVIVAGANTVWSINLDLYVGGGGVGNSLVISNQGAVVNNRSGYLGNSASSSNNSVLVTGTNSVWSLRNNLYVGNSGAGNRLVISDLSSVVNSNAFVGNLSSASSNSVRVADGATWLNNILYVGNQGSSNSLVVAGGSVLATNFIIGFASSGCDNLVQLDSGSIIVTNAAQNAVLEVRGGTFTLNSGTVIVDKFVMTNSCANFTRIGGTLVYGTAVLDPARDDDGDGLPNGWEQSYGLDPLDQFGSNGASGDPDNDGKTNLQEFQSGSSPTIEMKAITKESNDIRVTWQFCASKTNMLQRSSGDPSGSYSINNFTNLFMVTNAVGGVTNYLDVGGATNTPARYYRVRLVP